MVDTSAEKMIGVGLAGGVVICALLDTLHAKGILTLEEVETFWTMLCGLSAPMPSRPKASKQCKSSDSCAGASLDAASAFSFVLCCSGDFAMI